MLTRKEKKLVVRIQKTSLELYTKGQLPKCICSRIQKLSYKSSKDEVEILSELSERFLRVVGYYRKYPRDNQLAEAELCLRLKEKGII